MDKLSMLAIFAHPDDESCGPGATLAMYAHRGVDVTLVCTTKGEHGAWGDDQSIPAEQFGINRIQELACACRSLGIRRWTVLGYPDGGVAQCDGKGLEEDLVRWMREVEPQVVITHYPEGANGHPDHNAVARAATSAYLRAGHSDEFSEQLKQGLAPWAPLKLYYAMPPDPELAGHLTNYPPIMLDVSQFAQTKARALLCHQSQRECWQGLIKTLRRGAKWTESFYLVHSRVPRLETPEDDLFVSVPDAATRKVA